MQIHSKETQADILITGTGLWHPSNVITNEELVQSFNTYVQMHNTRYQQQIEAGSVAALQPSSVEFIEKASGIKQRYVWDKEGVLDPQRLAPRIPERSNDTISVQAEMAVLAAQEALRNAGKTAADVDGIILACSNMQRAYPAVSIEVQHYLGVQNGWAYDMNVACSSATFGIQAAADALRSASARCVLVVSSELTSGHLAWQDRDCHFIFGDVATAVVLERGEAGSQAPSFGAWKIISTKLQTQFSNNIRNNFGFLNRGDESGIGARDKLFMQEGRKVFKEVCPMVAEHILAHLDICGMRPENLSRMWLHQANLAMNQLIVKRVLGFEADETLAPVILDEFANTSSAGSIIAFHRHQHDLQAGSLGVICSFGAGYSIGSVLIQKTS